MRRSFLRGIFIDKVIEITNMMMVHEFLPFIHMDKLIITLNR